MSEPYKRRTPIPDQHHLLKVAQEAGHLKNWGTGPINSTQNDRRDDDDEDDYDDDSEEYEEEEERCLLYTSPSPRDRG
eukprot:1879786-Amphidinium_carterae.1